MSHLYKDFLTSSDEADRARSYWASLCRQVIPSYELGEWNPWLSYVYNPDDRSLEIFSLWNQSLARGFTITQLHPANEHPVIGARMDVFGSSHLERPIDYMAIWCELSEPSAMIAQSLISKWVNPALDVMGMSRIIDEIASTG